MEAGYYHVSCNFALELMNQEIELRRAHVMMILLRA